MTASKPASASLASMLLSGETRLEPAATKALAGLIEGKTVRLEFTEGRKRDNFGRLLCRVYVGDVDVGRWMIEHGHATEYVPRR